MPARKNRPGKHADTADTGVRVSDFRVVRTTVAAVVTPRDLAKRPVTPLTVSARRVVYTSATR